MKDSVNDRVKVMAARETTITQLVSLMKYVAAYLANQAAVSWRFVTNNKPNLRH